MNTSKELFIEGEEWYDIPEFEGLYQLSNNERVRSFHNGKIKIMSQQINCHGYVIVDLSKDSVTKHYGLHRIVAKTRIPNPNNYPCVNHKNEVKTDNRVENLEWCTHEYNNNYGTARDRIRKTLGKLVAQIDKNTLEIIATFSSAVDACNAVGGKSKGKVGDCCNGKSKTAYGYKWQYVEKEKEE